MAPPAAGRDAHARVRRVVTLYGAPDCHLCHEAEAKLRRVRRLVPFDLDLVDVRGDASLEERFGTSIPVVAVGDRVVLQAKVTEFRLLRLLPALFGRRPGR